MLLYKITQRQQNKKYKQINEKKVINNENWKFLKNNENSEEMSSVYPKIGENEQIWSTNALLKWFLSYTTCINIIYDVTHYGMVVTVLVCL